MWWGRKEHGLPLEGIASTQVSRDPHKYSSAKHEVVSWNYKGRKEIGRDKQESVKIANSRVRPPRTSATRITVQFKMLREIGNVSQEEGIVKKRRYCQKKCILTQKPIYRGRQNWWTERNYQECKEYDRKMENIQGKLRSMGHRMSLMCD